MDTSDEFDPDDPEHIDYTDMDADDDGAVVCKHEWCDFWVPVGMEYLFETHDEQHERLRELANLAEKHGHEGIGVDPLRHYVEENGWPL